MAKQSEEKAMRMGRLVIKKMNGELTEMEAIELDQWLSASEEYQQVHDEMMDGQTRERVLGEESPRDSHAVQEDVWERYKGKRPTSANRRLYLPIIGVAAAMISMLSIGFWYWRNTQEIPTQYETTNLITEDLTPATNKAVIILDDREEIALLENPNGIKAESGMISYANGDRIADIAEAKKITIKTPNAGFYKLTLPDQSVVWLNAASSIEYPISFGTNAREISVTGEAYLQVTPLPNKPFIVQTEGQKIEVLGTSFNVMAYPKEMPATTLVAGKVKITDIQSGTIHELLPNQQAFTNQAGTQIEQVDVSKATAWKDGYFVFDSMELTAVMRQLSRWYDVEVDYTNLPNRTISARIKRDKYISAVLNAISKTTDLDFYINERRMMLKR